MVKKKETLAGTFSDFKRFDKVAVFKIDAQKCKAWVYGYQSEELSPAFQQLRDLEDGAHITAEGKWDTYRDKEGRVTTEFVAWDVISLPVVQGEAVRQEPQGSSLGQGSPEIGGTTPVRHIIPGRHLDIDTKDQRISAMWALECATNLNGPADPYPNLTIVQKARLYLEWLEQVGAQPVEDAEAAVREAFSD